MEGYRKGDKISVVALISLGLIAIDRGFYWFILFASVVDESPLYVALHKLLPIWCWGLMLILFGTCLILAAVFYPKNLINNKSSNMMVIGGVGTGIIHFLMMSATISNSSGWFFPIQYCILATLFFYIAFIGGSERVRKR